MAISVDGSGVPRAASPSISVVIPTRDRPELLRRAVRAVIDQRFDADVECIIVFDRSEPVPPDVELRPGRTLRLLKNDRTPGLAGARNTGAVAATGELLAFCDDDDEWLPEKLTAQVGWMSRHPDAIAVASGVYVHTGGRDVERIPDREWVTFDDLLRSRWMEINPCNIVVRRTDFFGAIGPVDEDLPGSHNEDYEWLLRATRIGPIAVVPRPLVRINWGRPSWFAQRWRTLIASHLCLLERYPEFRTVPRGLGRMYGQLAFYHAAAGDRRGAFRWAGKTLEVSPTERRAYLAMVVAVGLISPTRLLAFVNRFGRGI